MFYYSCCCHYCQHCYTITTVIAMAMVLLLLLLLLLLLNTVTSTFRRSAGRCECPSQMMPSHLGGATMGHSRLEGLHFEIWVWGFGL